MSVAALNNRITAAKADNMISLQEARAIIAPNDTTFKSPTGLGNFVDKFEHKAVKELVNEIKTTDLNAEPRALRSLEKFVEKGPDSRWSHILKTMTDFKAGTVAGALPGFLAGGVAGFFVLMAVSSGGAGALVAGLAWLGTIALSGVVGGAIGASIQGSLDD